MTLLQDLRQAGAEVRRGPGEQLLFLGPPPLLEQAKAGKPRLLEELAEEEAWVEAAYRCPRCQAFDYRPLGNGRRHCHGCRQVYGGTAEPERPRALSRLPCPCCHAYPYSPGPEGLPQRRCHGCDHVWNPLTEEKPSETTTTT